jgi:hypothetical protein
MSSSHEFFQPVHPGLTPPGDPYLDYGPPLPERTGLERIHAIARDPGTVWVWWELPAAKTLSLRDMDRGIVTVIPAPGPVGTHYFHAAADRPYVVEIDGRLSNAVRTPRRGPATEVDPDWAPTPAEAEILHALSLRPESIRAVGYGGAPS